MQSIRRPFSQARPPWLPPGATPSRRPSGAFVSPLLSLFPLSSPLSRRTVPPLTTAVREAQELAASPSADLAAAPLESDLFEWHFTLRGPPNSSYAGGLYHGRIVLPPTYPLRPPSFRFVTPSGRFEANREICLSISGHHEETWQPAWGLRTALVALRAFMETDPRGQVGGLDASDAVRRRLAGESGAFVCNGCGGRTNAAILAESAAEEAALKTSEEGQARAAAAAAADGVVPPELTLAYRDELEARTAQAEASGSASPAAPATPATTTATTATTTTTPTAGTPGTSAPETPIEAQQQPLLPPPAAAPAHAVPVPTPTIPLTGAAVAAEAEAEAAAAAAVTARPPQPPHPPLTIAAGRAGGRMQPQAAGGQVQQAQAQLRRRRNSDDAVPLWVDRSIVVLCVVLGAMVLRLVFG